MVGAFLFIAFLLFMFGLIGLGLWWNSHNRKKTKKFMEKNGLRYKEKAPEIIQQFTKYYKLNLKTYNADGITDVITGTKNNIDITMFSTPQEGGTGSIGIQNNSNFKKLLSNVPEDFRKNKNINVKKSEPLQEQNLQPLIMHNNSTILKLDGNFELPKFKLIGKFNPPEFLKKLSGMPEQSLPANAIPLDGEFGKFFYLDYVENESVKDLFNIELLDSLLAKCLKEKGCIIGCPMYFVSFGNTVIVDLSMPANADMKIHLLETSIRLILLLKGNLRTI